MPVATSNSAYGIIRDAMQDAGLIGEGEDPNSEQLATNLRRLCDIINLCQTQGLKLFLQEEISVVLVANQFKYSINPASGLIPEKHLRVLDARVDTSSGTRRPVRVISRNEWMKLPQTSKGAITQVFVDKTVDSLDVYFWNTPDTSEAANTAVLLIHKQAANPFNLEQNMEFPQEWRIYLRWALADDIATGQPLAIMKRCAERAQYYKELLEDWDVEDASTSFGVDYHSVGVAGSFR